MKLRRFTFVQRLFHLLLMLLFMLQAATGLARMYIETGFGRWLAGLFGGYDHSLVLHKQFGIAMLILFAAHLLYILVTLNWRRPMAMLAGPDTLLPRGKDVQQFFQHVGWMLGISKHPAFDRWAYWEKFDYWAVFWGMVIIGGTGLLLYNPVASSKYVYGWSLNIALWVHRIEAALAIGHLFIIHFYIAHLRRSAFPMDYAMFHGSVDAEHAESERPAWVARLRQDGGLSEHTVPAPTTAARAVYLLFGYAVIVCGALMLVYGIALAPALNLL